MCVRVCIPVYARVRVCVCVRVWVCVRLCVRVAVCVYTVSLAEVYVFLGVLLICGWVYILGCTCRARALLGLTLFAALHAGLAHPSVRSKLEHYQA